MQTDDSHPAPPDIDGAAEAVAKASHRDSLDLVVEVVKFRYLQEMEASRRRLMGVVIGVLSLGAAVAGLYIQSAVANIDLEVLKGRHAIEETTKSAIARITKLKDSEFER
jgi:hypothetical protein